MNVGQWYFLNIQEATCLFESAKMQPLLSSFALGQPSVNPGRASSLAVCDRRSAFRPLIAYAIAQEPLGARITRLESPFFEPLLPVLVS
jgi:hypothetical protein